MNKILRKIMGWSIIAFILVVLPILFWGIRKTILFVVIVIVFLLLCAILSLALGLAYTLIQGNSFKDYIKCTKQDWNNMIQDFKRDTNK